MEQSKKQTGTLGLGSLITIMAGTLIGPGVVTLIGPSIAATGQGAWLAYAVAVVLGLFLVLPYALLCNAIRINGGNYTFIAASLGDVWGGIFGMAYTLNFFGVGLFGVSFAMYLTSLIPSLNATVVGVIFLTFFYVINLFGINLMAKIQNILFGILIFGMLCYIGFGLMNLDSSIFEITRPDYFSNGVSGFFSAVLILIFSTASHFFGIVYSKDAKNPKRDMPLTIIIASGIILVLFVSLSFVTCGVLPVPEVAGKPLTVVAQQIMPAPLYYIFVIGGPIMAIATTTNSVFTSLTRPLYQACIDGWYPRKLAATNKAGVPYIFMTIIYLLGIIPVILGLDISTITGNLVLINSISDMLVFAAVMHFPKALDGAWENRHFKVSMPVFKFLIWIAVLIRVACIVASYNTLTPTIFVITVVVFGAFFLYCFLWKRHHTVKIEKSYSIE